MTPEQQQLHALGIANATRTQMAQACQEVRTGQLTLAKALEDPRAQATPVGRLLCAQRAWGPTKAQGLLNHLFIYPTRRVKDLTANQRNSLLEYAPLFGPVKR